MTSPQVFKVKLLFMFQMPVLYHVISHWIGPCQTLKCKHLSIVWSFSTWGKVLTSCRWKWSSCWWILPSFTCWRAWRPLAVCVRRCCLALCRWTLRTRSLIFLRIRPGIKKERNQEAGKGENDNCAQSWKQLIFHLRVDVDVTDDKNT